MEPEGEDTRPLRHIAESSCIHSFSRYILSNYTCQSLLGAVDTAKNETCVAHASFKNAEPVSSPLKPALCSQTPYQSPGLSVQRGRGCTSSSGTGTAGRRHRAYAGCHTPGGRGLLGYHDAPFLWTPTVPVWHSGGPGDIWASVPGTKHGTRRAQSSKRHWTKQLTNLFENYNLG